MGKGVSGGSKGVLFGAKAYTNLVDCVPGGARYVLFISISVPYVVNRATRKAKNVLNCANEC